ncbi:hypothetical protein BDA99DRAFT_544503 [Phascolomyces articulosus]|uniref:Uncharacterized protein n=1 Tax=Phascolomyces articulosus TaxID=60185 RepID=A0AAD5P6Q8_9FUNG|nr:hypothetical protein BDA99DRAFT_544503 [Phascolomyces articulosus]
MPIIDTPWSSFYAINIKEFITPICDTEPVQTLCRYGAYIQHIKINPHGGGRVFNIFPKHILPPHGMLSMEQVELTKTANFYYYETIVYVTGCNVVSTPKDQRVMRSFFQRHIIPRESSTLEQMRICYFSGLETKTWKMLLNIRTLISHSLMVWKL